VRVSEVFAPSTLLEALAVLRRMPDALVWAGGTEIMRLRVAKRPDLPPTILSVDRIPELRAVGRGDRGVDLGAALTLAELADLREGAVPAALREAARGVATEPVRNLATLGGNILAGGRFMDLFPVLACLDAIGDFRDGGGSRWVSIGRLAGPDLRPSVPRGELLVRVRVPLDPWDLGIVRKIGYPLWPSDDTAVFACLARTGKGTLSEFRAALGGPIFLRDRGVETALLGRRLPLAAEEADEARRAWREAFAAAGAPEAWIGRFLAAADEAFDALGAGTRR
jgi:CO/xanthine dehydrogenase FAD-binding subunit